MDLKAPLKMNIRMLQFVGLWPQGDGYYKVDCYSIYAAFSITFLILGHNLSQVINCFYISDDLEAFTASTLVVVTEMVALVKSYYCIKNLPIIKMLLANLDEEIFQPKTEAQKTIARGSLKVWKTVYMTFFVSSNVTLLMWGLFPLLDKSVKEKRLPFQAWYPFNHKAAPYYQIAFIYQMLSTCFIVNTNINLDTFIAALMVNISVQCELLCDCLKNFKATSSKSKNFNGKFIQYVEYHKCILKFAGNSNKFFNVIIMGQFSSSIAGICMTMFQLTLVTPFTMEFYSLSFTQCSMFIQILLYCWFGNEVIEKSGKIPNAAFEINWIDGTCELRKNMMFFIRRTQRPIKLYAVNFFVVSLTSFVTILRTSWSYFALLQQVNRSIVE